MKTDGRRKDDAQNLYSSRRQRHENPSPPRGHRISASRGKEHRSRKRSRSRSPGGRDHGTQGTTRIVERDARDDVGDHSDHVKDHSDRRKKGDREKARKAKKARSGGSKEHRDDGPGERKRNKNHASKQNKTKKQRRRGEEKRTKSSKNDKQVLEESSGRRRKISSSSSSSSSEGEDGVETPMRGREERKSGKQGAKGSAGGECESSTVLREDAPTPPADNAAGMSHDTDSFRKYEAVGLDEDAPTPPASPGVRTQEVDISGASATDKCSFFAKLRALEGGKGTIGTVHATSGVQGPRPEPIKSNDWDCLKCGTSNYKNASSCHRCHALKRMTLWRD